MRVFASVCLLAASTAAVAQAPKRKPAPARTMASLPSFSFMGETPDAVTTRTKLNDADCGKNGAKLECTDYNDPKVGDTILDWLSMSFYNGKLYSVMGALTDNQYGKLLSAMTAKYGKPSVTTEKWQSKGGAVFDNTVATWLFRDGMLKLESKGQSVDKSFFGFVSAKNSPPDAPPKVDF